jgi:DNA-binding ferritin-like protein
MDENDKFEIDKQKVTRQVEALREGKVKLHSLDEAEKMIEDALAQHEQLLNSAKKIAKSAKEEYDLLNG